MKSTAARAFTYFASKHYGIPLRTSRAALHAVAGFIAQEICEKGHVRMRTVGQFTLTHRKGRGKATVNLRNYKTGERIVREVFMPDSWFITFKASRHLKRLVKKQNESTKP
jgi:nucleoid DNA-binding protein